VSIKSEGKNHRRHEKLFLGRRAASLSLHEGSYGEPKKHKAAGNDDEPHDPSEILEPQLWRRGFDGGQLSALEQALVLRWMFFSQFPLGLTARESNEVLGKASWPQMRVEKVDRENEPYGEERFLAVNQQRNIEPGPGHESCNERSKPHGISRNSDNRHAQKTAQ
jgi:hypothetical protein